MRTSNLLDVGSTEAWYDSHRAREHLERKYKYLLGKNLVDSAETFIALAARKSSMSGERYQVRCGNDAVISSADWLGHKALPHSLVQDTQVNTPQCR